jgi:hypothetical protein
MQQQSVDTPFWANDQQKYWEDIRNIIAVLDNEIYNETIVLVTADQIQNSSTTPVQLNLPEIDVNEYYDAIIKPKWILGLEEFDFPLASRLTVFCGNANVSYAHGVLNNIVSLDCVFGGFSTNNQPSNGEFNFVQATDDCTQGDSDLELTIIWRAKLR